MGAFVSQEERCTNLIDRCGNMIFENHINHGGNARLIAALSEKLRSIPEQEAIPALTRIKLLEQANVEILNKINTLTQRKLQLEKLRHSAGDTEIVREMLGMAREALSQVRHTDATQLETSVDMIDAFAQDAAVGLELEVTSAEVQERIELQELQMRCEALTQVQRAVAENTRVADII